VPKYYDSHRDGHVSKLSLAVIKLNTLHVNYMCTYCLIRMPPEEVYH
jgi:hypothetical protein